MSEDIRPLNSESKENEIKKLRENIHLEYWSLVGFSVLIIGALFIIDDINMIAIKVFLVLYQIYFIRKSIISIINLNKKIKEIQNQNI